MKRTETWLLAVLALTAGILLGFYLGRSFSDEPTIAMAPSTTSRAGAAPPTSDSSPEPMVHDWVSRQAEAFQQAPENHPTPGLQKAILEAMQPRDLYGDQAILRQTHYAAEQGR